MNKSRIMYHTQDYGQPYLQNAQMCIRDDAWLGKGYYFWYEEDDAVFWGMTAKRKYKKYSVYSANIDCENVLDTVFNEEHYVFWLKAIDKAVSIFLKHSSRKPSIEDINSYFMEKGVGS